VRAWYKSSGFVVLNQGPFLVQELLLYSNLLRSGFSTISVAVSYIVVRAWC
jgi:hypothetical protein